MSALCRAQRHAGADVVTLDSPHNRNALSLQLLDELLAHVAAGAGNDSRALVLDHAGPVFCAGVDLRERAAGAATPAASSPGAAAPAAPSPDAATPAAPSPDAATPPAPSPDAATRDHSALLARLLRALWEHPKPVLCRVGGPVRGGGMGLVACADVVVASPRATFAYSEVKVGVAPALVLAVTLPKLAPGPLLPHLLTGEPFGADTAHALGLVSRLGESLDAELAAIGAAGPAALHTVRRLALPDVAAALAEAERLSAELFAGEEAHEGMAAFLARRPPAWVA